MQKHLIYCFIGSALLIQACKNQPHNEAKNAEAQIPVRLLSLQQSATAQPIYATGRFTTDDETLLAFKTGGIVQSIAVNEGDPVRKGQLLATLNLTEIDAQVQQATLALDKAQRDYQRVAALYRDSVATLEQMQNTKTALDIAKQQVDAARFNKSYSEIRASQNGYVLRKLANVGQVVSPGVPVVQVNGAAASDWLLKVSVSDQQWSAIRKGDAATVTTDVAPNQPLAASVFRKSEGIDPATGTFSISLRLAAKPTTGVAAGLFGKATIQPTQKTASWNIPYDAVLDADSGAGYVFVTNDQKTARRVKVLIAGITPNSVLVTDGLQDAQALIISGSAYLNDQSPIKVIR